MNAAPDRPLLRFRDGDADDWFERDVRVVGTIERVDEDTVRIVQGPNLSTELYLDDLAPLFEDDPAFTLAILADAAINRDVVQIALTSAALTYVNSKQEERFAAPDASPLVAVPSRDELEDLESADG